MPGTSIAGAQPRETVWRIGYLDQGSAARDGPSLDGLRQWLRELGWIEGQHIVIEVRFTEGRTEHRATLAAKQATTRIPIVMGFAADPVGTGIVASLAHPGGNITGWTHLSLELRAKDLELLEETVPWVTRAPAILASHEDAARKLRVAPHLADVQDPREIEPAVSELLGRGVRPTSSSPAGCFSLGSRSS